MQEITQQSNAQIKGIQANLDFDLDDFDFKPVTKGLGFHHNKDTEKTVRTYQRPQAKSKHTANIPVRESVSVVINASKVKETSQNIAPVSKKEKTKVRPARMGIQFTSFIFDLILLCSIQISLNFIFLKIARLESIVQLVQFTWIEQLLFFSFTFLFYFTIFDLVASPGKKIFSMRLMSTASKKVTIDQTLIRAVVTLLSFVTMGMPLVFDFQGKLSDTKLIEDV